MSLQELTACVGMLVLFGCALSRPAHGINGLWVHPANVIEPDVADRTLDQAQRSGVDNIYVLVFHHEQAWFKTPHCPMSEDVAEGFDPLGYCIGAGHKRGIKVHAWFVNGQAGDGGKPGAILSEHPDWQAVDATGSEVLWFDLANPEVQRYQKDLMLSAVKGYPELDGVHFDYIRFSGDSLSYAPAVVEAFRKATGFEAPGGEGEAGEKQVAAWKQWRMDRISDLVKDVYRSAKRIRPGVEVTAAVFYNKASADAVLQDWRRWVREGCIDCVMPMAYVGDVASLEKAFDEWDDLPHWQERVIPGLCLYRRENGKPAPRSAGLVGSQVELCRKRGAAGIVFFCCHYISPELEPVMKGAPSK